MTTPPRVHDRDAHDDSFSRTGGRNHSRRQGACLGVRRLPLLTTEHRPVSADLPIPHSRAISISSSAPQTRRLECLERVPHSSHLQHTKASSASGERSVRVGARTHSLFRPSCQRRLKMPHLEECIDHHRPSIVSERQQTPPQRRTQRLHLRFAPTTLAERARQLAETSVPGQLAR